ncbi:aminotransferase class V-fold PLP-dependent enzyme [Mesorhizobium sp. AR02]|uniref:pyridoxal phosphate-dependent decarboxylase family protein n=1 Tax=Mesorhizobium sp. AR02 TaxID=2865837 RepID=UPI00215E439C|nr:aminotransferase class V-fold PLP-dependent enzyme [Mesorhizobium sp. AR02]UVK51760.1 aminotransferase class V-fold PLP-dependent enzyme [Mesorhizobium sp. AR02]
MAPDVKQGRAAASDAADTSASLDPVNWDQFREIAHGLLDDMIAHIETIRQRPVWQRPTDEARERFTRPLPNEPRDLDDVLDDVRTHIMPFATGNLHPSFMGWVHGAGTPIGMVAEIVAGGLNMNCGGRDHAGLAVEQQIVRWMSEALGYPDGASGLFLTGSSMANFAALTIAKTEALGQSVRETGLRNCDRELVAYTSAEAHSCIAQAMQLSGIGSANLRTIAVDDAGRMLPDTLRAAIEQDRAEGFLPFLVVGTAGTVNTGAIDPLAEIAEIASRESLWFHVDGAIGALAVLSGSLRELFKGIERSASVALDFHKWGQVPYDAGFLLVRDGDAHKRAFAQPAAYLQRADRGLAAGETWPCDLGPDLSRGFRALKTWMTIEALGTDRIGGSIAHTCMLARHLAERLERHPEFQLKAPVALNIVCFGIRGANSEFVRTLVSDLQESGLAAPSWTTLNGELVVRCAIVNHRTTVADIDSFVGTLDRYLDDRAAEGNA